MYYDLSKIIFNLPIKIEKYDITRKYMNTQICDVCEYYYKFTEHFKQWFLKIQP